MADDNLSNPVIVQATRVDASILPRNIFSQPYLLYVIQQGQDFGKIAGKANEAGQGAYDAQVKNDEQDATLGEHDKRLDSAEATLENHGTRIAKTESDISSLGEKVSDVESDLAELKGDAVLKSASINQVIQANGGSFVVGSVAEPTADKLQVSDSINAGISYKVAGLKIIGPRQTGWTAATGTALLDAFDVDLSQSISATFVQSEIQSLNDNIVSSRKRIKALEDALREHGLIN